MQNHLRTVLTIHGVGIFGGRGPWQKSVSKVLAPHFKCDPVDYPEYRWFGLITAVMEPWVLLPSIPALVILARIGLIQEPRLWTLAVVVASFAAAGFRYRRALSKVQASVFSSSYWESRPHVIAHSMGSRLIGTVLQKYPQARFGHLVFAGCVLPTNYCWRGVLSDNPQAFDRIRNDVGSCDFIACLAEKAHRIGLLKRFGMSGKVGFQPLGEFIHTVRSPNLCCNVCKATGKLAPVHNVMTKFDHNGVFDNPGYVAAYWLPFLWGIDPCEYSRFVTLCRDAEEHYESQKWTRYEATEAVLLHKAWSWTDNLPLKEYVQRELKAASAGKHFSHFGIGAVVQGTWRNFVEALSIYQAGENGWQQRVAALNPSIALRRAIYGI